MKLLIEGEYYPESELSDIFDDAKFYQLSGTQARITSVGYYHSFENNRITLMLPKVFMQKNGNTVFGCSAAELTGLIGSGSVKHEQSENWLRQLSVHFYNSLSEFRKRYQSSTITQTSEVFELNTNLGEHEYSYLDILLSMVNFYKKNRNYILYKHIEFTAGQISKPRWEKTLRKSLPLITAGGKPVYDQILNRRKVADKEENLIIYFFSILNRLNEDHQLAINIDRSYPLIRGERFDSLRMNGLPKLKKIRYRYYSDIMRRMYTLCELYFSQYDRGSVRRRREDFIAVSNYNIVFEDMIDRLFSDEMAGEGRDGELESLRRHEDGKIIDHIYCDRSLLDDSNIFYIGDSKYYRSDNSAKKESFFKQFTYARNVLQYNIDLQNKNQQFSPGIRYRDELTEGYNITPNFFIYGKINSPDNYQDDELEVRGLPEQSNHFAHRLFDRDTLFVHQ